MLPNIQVMGHTFNAELGLSTTVTFFAGGCLLRHLKLELHCTTLIAQLGLRADHQHHSLLSITAELPENHELGSQAVVQIACVPVYQASGICLFVVCMALLN
jgi:hypothetical protein